MGKQCFTDHKDRYCIEVTLVGPADRRGNVHQVTQRLLVDTGCPVELILDDRTLQRTMLDEIESKPSNFGWLSGYMVRVLMPDMDFDKQIPAYANAAAVRIAREDGFHGIAGKPFLDHFHFSNGNGSEFCLESWQQYRALINS